MSTRVSEYLLNSSQCCLRSLQILTPFFKMLDHKGVKRIHLREHGITWHALTSLLISKRI